MRARISSVLRYALLALVAVGAATTSVSANDRGNPGELFASCIETKDFNSDECLRALAATGLGPEFYAGLAANRDLQLKSQQQEQDLWTMVKACVDTHDLRSAECKRAIETSG